MASDFLSYFNLNATLQIYIEPSEHLDADQIAQINVSVERITYAVKNGDLSLAIGCAKELSESMAKIAIYSTGNTFVDKIDFKPLISMAHKAVDRHPNDFSEAHPSLRTIIQAQKSIVGELNTFRNDFGTGHGHARQQQIEHEIALTSIEAAIIWCRWLMRRLDDLLANSPNTLRKQLDGGQSFYKGDLTRMLKNIDLPALDEDSQRAIGVSVARRANTGTFNVSEEGIDACLNRYATVPWTTQYILGLIVGLVSTSEGQIYITKDLIGKVQRLLLLVSDFPTSLNFLIENLIGMSPVSRFKDINFRNEVVDELRIAIDELTESKDFWMLLISVLREENLDFY